MHLASINYNSAFVVKIYMKNIIEGKGISFSYDGSEVIKNVDISISDGRFIGLLGANGSGKSTLLKILCGILNIKNGNILYENKELRHISKREVARRISYVPQHSTFGFPFTVSEVIQMGRAPYIGRFEFEGERDREIVFNVMETLGLLHLQDRLVSEISGGEKQLTSLARALAQEPEIMILDEPATFLDFKHKTEIFKILWKLKEERQISILAATHDIFSSLSFFDEIIILKDGEIFAKGNCEEVLTGEILSQAYGTEVRVRKDDGRIFVYPV